MEISRRMEARQAARRPAPRNLPALVISVGLHAGGLLVLSLLGFVASRQAEELILVSSAALDESEPLDEMLLETPPLEMSALEPQPLETTAVPALDAASVAPPVPSTSGVEVALPSTSDPGREIERLVNQDSALAAGPATGAGSTDAGAEFFGVHARGRRFVFIVDSSRSMKGGRFLAACRELVRAIRNLQEDQFFYVIFFDEHPERMRLPPDREPPSRPVPATRANIARFEQWLVSVQLEAGTDPQEALAWALEMSPDAAYVLSDGEFGGRAERFLQERNWREDASGRRVPRMVIHTVGFHQKRASEALARIAAQFGGSYRFVPSPVAPARRRR